MASAEAENVDGIQFGFRGLRVTVMQSIRLAGAISQR